MTVPGRKSVPDRSQPLAPPADRVQFSLMELTYPINFIDHDEWMQSGYDPRLSEGEVITRDGEIIGQWRVVGYDPDDEYSAGRFEFLALGEVTAMFQEDFAMLDVRMHRGFALSNLTRTIREWYETNNPRIS